MVDGSDVIESAGKAIAEVQETPLDSIIEVFPVIFEKFSEESPYLAAILFIFLVFCTTTVMLSPVLMYFKRQNTKKHSNILEYQLSMEKMRLQAESRKHGCKQKEVNR